MSGFRPDLWNPYPFSDVAIRQKLCYHFLCFSNSHISKFLFIWYWNDKYVHTQSLIVLSKTGRTLPDSRPKWESVFPFSDKIVPNALSFGAAHTRYIAYTGEYRPFTGGLILRPDRPHDFTILGSKIYAVSCERGRRDQNNSSCQSSATGLAG